MIDSFVFIFIVSMEILKNAICVNVSVFFFMDIYIYIVLNQAVFEITPKRSNRVIIVYDKWKITTT